MTQEVGGVGALSVLAPRVGCVSPMYGVGTGGQYASRCKMCYRQETLRSIVSKDNASFRGYNRQDVRTRMMVMSVRAR